MSAASWRVAAIWPGAAVLLSACAGFGGSGGAVDLCVQPGQPITATWLQSFRSEFTATRGGSLIAPEQIAVSQNDMLVADRGRGELLRIDRAAQRVSVVTKTFGRVAGLHIDRLRSIYLALPAQRVVQQLALDGRIERNYRDPEGLTTPVDVVTDGTGQVFVADGANARVIIFNRFGEVTGTFGERVGRSNPFLSVTALALDSGTIHVLDASARRVHSIGADGVTGTLELGNRVRFPVALAVDRWHRLLIADRSGGRVFLLDVSSSPIPYKVEGLPRIALLSDLWIDEFGLLFLANAGTGTVISMRIPGPCPS